MILIHTSVGRTASTWLESVFLAICDELPLRCEPRGAAAYLERLAGPGLENATIHPGVFLPWHDLALDRCEHPWRVFHVRRDPRDVLISAYFANAYSHRPNEEVQRRRPILLDRSLEDGLVWLVADGHESRLDVLMSHLGRTRSDGCLTVEFADLVSRPLKQLRAMLDFAGWPMPQRTLRNLIDARSFERQAGGRRRGQEDPHHHFRKGIVGDWKNHFTPRVKEAYKERFGKALIELGYERSLDW